MARQPRKNPDYCQAGMAAAVIDVATGDILALVSLPTYDLNSARNNCDDLRIDANHPLTNRAIDYLYAPGSAVKPLILIAALETGLIAAEEPIELPRRATGGGLAPVLDLQATRCGSRRKLGQQCPQCD